LCEGLVEEGTAGMRLQPSATSSSKTAWKDRASTLFDAGHFAQAEWAFVKAGCEEEAAIARAHATRENADSAKSQSHSSYLALYANAAEQFSHIANTARHSHGIYTRIAAECYAEGGHHIDAADIYSSIGLDNRAAQQYFLGSDIDKAMFILNKSDDIDEDVRRKITEAAKILYLKRKVCWLHILRPCPNVLYTGI
jgi:hypothetical protein